MGTSSNRKLYVAVLGLGLAGLAVDKLFLSGNGLGPAEASADQVTAGGDDPTAATAPATKAIESSPGSALARRLRECKLSLAATPMDPFDTPRVVTKEGEAEVLSPEEQLVKTFKEAHKLRSVMLAATGLSIAVIDDARLKVGDVLDGFELTNLDTRSATFTRDDIRVELTLETLETGTD